jgi:receptor protein-tyrosine kinase
LTDVLIEEHSLQEVCKEPIEGLFVVPVGPIPLRPAELLSTQRFSEFLTTTRDEFDYVLIDTPPIGVVSDPLVLAAQVDGVLLVLDAQSTRKGAVRQAINSLNNVGARLLGTVMNHVKVSKEAYYTYYLGDYYYGSR